MGKKKSNNKGKITKTPVPSSGNRRVARARYQLRRAKMKINRWERNQNDETQNSAGKSRGNWNTAGLKRHVKTQEKIIAQGPTRPNMRLG